MRVSNRQQRNIHCITFRDYSMIFYRKTQRVSCFSKHSYNTVCEERAGGVRDKYSEGEIRPDPINQAHQRNDNRYLPCSGWRFPS